MSLNIKTQVKQVSQEVAQAGQDAVGSGAWLYPIYGILYLRNASVWSPIRKQIAPRLILATVVLVVLFSTVYVPQSLFLSLFSGPLGFVSAVPLVISESQVVITLLSSFLGTNLDLIFDQVLLDHGLESLVKSDRIVTNGKLSFKSKLKSPLSRFSPEALVKYLVSLPLNSIPAVGTIIFLLLNGKRSGPRFLSRYFQLKGMDQPTTAQTVKSRQGALTSFGVSTAVLNMVPLLNQIFVFSNVIGAALWAVEMEKQKQQ